MLSDHRDERRASARGRGGGRAHEGEEEGEQVRFLQHRRHPQVPTELCQRHRPQRLPPSRQLTTSTNTPRLPIASPGRMAAGGAASRVVAETRRQGGGQVEWTLGACGRLQTGAFRLREAGAGRNARTTLGERREEEGRGVGVANKQILAEK
jgi:hypothetical protein